MKDEIETIYAPKRIIDLAERRKRGIIKASCHDANVLRSIALSCYVQGLIDGSNAESSARQPPAPEGEQP